MSTSAHTIFGEGERATTLQKPRFLFPIPTANLEFEVTGIFIYSHVPISFLDIRADENYFEHTI